MKQTATNQFNDGMNLDLHPIVTPNSVLTDNINGTFITYNGNEFCLQNDRGNICKASLTSGFVPIGIKEHNGVIYIVSCDDDGNTEIGNYPGINWNNREGSLDPEKYSAFNQELNLNFSKSNPVQIEIQDSYDGSVNLILTDGENKPKIINSGFSVIGDKYKIIERNTEELDQSTDDSVNLIRENSTIANINLLSVQSGGQLKGGNYTFYVKFGDSDYNQTDVVAESGIVSIFNGTDGVPSTISGTLAEERTDKMIQLKITGINNIYSKLYVYFSREYSDTNGFRMSEAGMITEPFDIQGVEYGGEKTIWITGYEQQTAISIEDLNIDYHTIDFAKTAAQQQDMLFLGNVGQSESGTNKLYTYLKDFVLNHVKTKIRQCSDEDGVDGVSYDYQNGSEYYNTKNIYDRLGYWPDEFYRFGVVFILKDGSSTPVFNVCGGKFNAIDDEIDITNRSNSKGVFLTPSAEILSDKIIREIDPEDGSVITKSVPYVKPLYFSLTIDSDLSDEFKNKIVGWFIVRQKRIPRTICQGLSIGIDRKSGLPLLPVYDSTQNKKWLIESFLSFDRKEHKVDEKVCPKLIYTSTVLKNDSSGDTSDLKFLYDTTGPIEFFPSGTLDQVNWNLVKEIYNSTKPLKNTWLQVEYGDSGVIGPPIHIDLIEEDFEFHQPFDPNYYGLYIIFDNRVNWNEIWSRQYSLYKYSFACVKDSRDYGLVYYYSLYSDFPDSFKIDGEDYYISSATLDELKNLGNRFLLFDSTFDGNAPLLKGSALLSLDPCVNNSVSGMLDGSKYTLVPEYTTDSQWSATDETLSMYSKLNIPYNIGGKVTDNHSTKAKCAFVKNNTIVKMVDNYLFSNVAGNAYSVKDYKQVGWGYYLVERKVAGKEDLSLAVDGGDGKYSSKSTIAERDIANINLARGMFCPYVGIGEDVGDNKIKDSYVYSIRLNEPDDINLLFSVREQDNSSYYCVSKRFKINDNNINVFNGDCYTNTVSIRMLRNFIGDPALSESILGIESWGQFMVYCLTNRNEKMSVDEASEKVNLSDLNTVDLGYWVTFKCLSSYNLGLRSENPFDTTEYAYFNSPKSFYPLRGMSRLTGAKIEESFLLNDGYNATVGEKRYNLLQEAPYYKSEYDTRIMFSNKQVQDQFTNGYRVFQGLSYYDYDKQYGSIVKLEPWGNNLFCVFEHGCAILPVNEKALMQTTTEQTIHIYGHGVLLDQMSIASADYGSKYAQTVVRTPIGIYGIDTDAKKIWRFSDKQGFETLSDMKIESFLNKCLEPIYNIDISNCDIRTHYNSFKGDVIFTWYSGKKSSNSICYNERQGVWTTKYDWVPIVSENANGEFYSLQYSNRTTDPVKIYSHAVKESEPTKWYDQQHKFEFEFVVSDPIGVNKVFDNLQIISNNVQPEGLEISVIGDSYMFKRDEVPDMDPREKYRKEYENINTETTSNIHGEKSGGDIRYDYDETLDQSIIVKSQDFKDIYKYGRRIGNIQYRDGIWYAQIEPLRWTEENKQKEARIRDKWAKIRIRYSGEDLAVITAIKTIVNI